MRPSTPRSRFGSSIVNELITRSVPETLQIISRLFPVQNYVLGETLSSGQSFRWRPIDNAWEGVVHKRWVRLSPESTGIVASVALPATTSTEKIDWSWLIDYLQLNTNLPAILHSFPKDEHLGAAIKFCPGLRLLKQEPWECLASFILSSTKQIVQIQQIVELLCERFGEPVPCPPGRSAYSFPPPERLAALSESDLRCCKMGFRAPYLRGTAQMIIAGEVQLNKLGQMDVTAAREQLMRFPGVGRKIADCVLLFAYGFQEAFPIDVWVLKAIRQLYFPNRWRGKNATSQSALRKVQEFTRAYFGPNAGYAQQYLFHYMRTHIGRSNKNEKN